MANGSRWTLDELELAFHLYCELPFGRLHARNPEIIELAELLHRTPSSVAMKLVNFASLDPAITSTGRSGLGNASELDRSVWDEYHRDWDRLAIESERRLDRLRGQRVSDNMLSEDTADYVGETASATVEVRRRQQFFRRAVLASYEGQCCMSGITAQALLVASHIIPWNADAHNRLNPRNGLCLSALHDRAFDRGLITVEPDLSIRVASVVMKHQDEDLIRRSLIDLDGRSISAPERFRPDPAFLEFHNRNIFKGR